MAGSKVLNAAGAYVARTPKRGAVRSALVSGESIEAMDLAPSTVQRGISWTVSEATPLYRGRGEAVPMVEALRKSGAQALVKSFIVQLSLRDAEHGATPDERRELYRFRGQRHAEVGQKVLKRDFPGMTERDREGLAPILGGIAAVAQTGVLAAKVAGDDLAVKRFQTWKKEAWASVGQAWERHRATFAEAEERTWQPIVERLAELIAVEGARMDGDASSFGKMGVGDDSDIAIFPGKTADILSDRGFKGMTSRKLGVALGEIIKNRKHSVRVGRGTVSAWLIDGSKWRLVVGEHATEAAAGYPAPAPLPRPGAVDWDRALRLLDRTAVATATAIVHTDEYSWPED